MFSAATKFLIFDHTFWNFFYCYLFLFWFIKLNMCVLNC